MSEMGSSQWPAAASNDKHPSAQNERQIRLRENAVAPMNGKGTLRRELECLKDDAFSARLCWLKIE